MGLDMDLIAPLAVERGHQEFEPLPEGAAEKVAEAQAAFLEMTGQEVEFISNGPPRGNAIPNPAFESIFEALGLDPEYLPLAEYYWGPVPSMRVLAPVAQWRKANAIHGYFVRNVATTLGEQLENREVYPMEREELAELSGLCAEVLATVEFHGVIHHDHDEEGEPPWSNPEGWDERLVVLDEGLAAAKLPWLDGMFWGPREYNDKYVFDLEYTVERLDKILADPALALVQRFGYRGDW